MISFKTYVKALLIIIGMIFIPALFVDLLQDPLNGDLTRIGMFSENDYGWNKASLKLAQEPKLKGNINEHYDVIILGDSFSHNSSSWSKILSLSTNLNIGQFHTNKYHDVFEFINLLKSNGNLPRVFIYESVERGLKSRLKKFNECPSQSTKYSNIPTIKYNINELLEVPYLRNSKLRVDDLGFTLQYIKANLLENHGKVNKFKLNNSSLFSNLRSDEILVYSDDLNTTLWSDNDWNKIKCNALHIQDILNKSKLTAFVFLVAPDKTTVYKKFIDKNNISGSRLDILASSGELNFLRVDDFLTQKIEQGEKDIYWPNDTHWSYRGHKLVAEKMISYLIEKNLIKIAN